MGCDLPSVSGQLLTTHDEREMSLHASTILLLFTTIFAVLCKQDEVIQLYFGLDESERGVPACSSPAEACGVLLERYWRPAALLRLCRCPRRQPCPASVHSHLHTLKLNNRAHFKFCGSIDNLPACKNSYVGLSVEMSQPTYSPDEFESLHHQNTFASPPKITAYCSCAEPYNWRLYSRNTSDGVYPSMLLFKCGPLKVCKSGEFCGNVRADVESLYQSCSCPEQHMCVHNGGLQLYNVTELLYNGKGRKAHCEPMFPDMADDTEEYYDDV